MKQCIVNIARIAHLSGSRLIILTKNKCRLMKDKITYGMSAYCVIIYILFAFNEEILLNVHLVIVIIAMQCGQRGVQQNSDP